MNMSWERFMDLRDSVVISGQLSLYPWCTPARCSRIHVDNHNPTSDFTVLDNPLNCASSSELKLCTSIPGPANTPLRIIKSFV